MDEEGDVWIGDEVQRLFRGGVGGHYYGGGGGVGGRGEVGVVHEGDVGKEVCAGCQVELEDKKLD